MKKTLLVILIIYTTSFTQVSPDWVQRYTANGGGATALVTDSQGNLYVTGNYDLSGGNRNIVTIKYNQEGEQQWIQIHPAGNQGGAAAIAVDADDNILITGSSNEDVVTIRYNSAGNQEWIKTYNGPLDDFDTGTAITTDIFGNAYVTGYVGTMTNALHGGEERDMVTIKYTSAGTQLWEKIYGSHTNQNQRDVGNSIQADQLGNVYVAGYTTDDQNKTNAVTLKYDGSGNLVWDEIFTTADLGSAARKLLIFDDEHIYVGGNELPAQGGSDYLLIKYNSAGSQLWAQTYSGPGTFSEVVSSMAVDSTGNIYVTGVRGDDYSVVTIKYAPDGTQLWLKSNTQGYPNYNPSISADADSNIYVTVESHSPSSQADYLTIKYDVTGQEEWFIKYTGIVSNSNDSPTSIGIDNSGNIFVCGSSGGDFATIKYSSARKPVLIVPGIAGTYASNVDDDLAWLVERGTSPENIQVDPLANVYKDLIATLENVGYEMNKDLFVVNYDWRLLPAPLDNNFDGFINGLSGTSIADDEFNYGVDYLGWYIKNACDRWRTDYNEELDYVNIISHSTGGLVTRAYIQSNAYGAAYDAANNYKLAKIQDFIMIGVPNRGASKAWNPIHDNWIADEAYRFVLSKIINRAFQKIKKGYIITGPDYLITWGSILDSLGNPNKELFIKKYVPTINGLLATFDFIDFGNGLTNVNSNSLLRNSLILDLNSGYDLYSNVDPNGFLDSAQVSVLYGVARLTFDGVEERDDFEINAIQSFTDWLRTSVSEGTIWYNDFPSGENNGDETVPTVSAVGQFQNDSRAIKIPCYESNHTGMVTTIEMQSHILNILNVNYDQNQIVTGSWKNWENIINVISDPVELFLIDGNGNRLGYSNSTGKVTEIPNSSWFGNTEGMGYVFGSIPEPINLQLTGLGEDYYVIVSVEDQVKGGGVVLEGFLALGEVINYQITLDPLSVDQFKSLTPDNFELAQNYPNPFNPLTSIQYAISNRQFVSLKIYDVLGNEIATLVNEEQDRGVYTVNFDASNLASGLYLYRIQAGSFTETKKMIFLK